MADVLLLLIYLPPSLRISQPRRKAGRSLSRTRYEHEVNDLGYLMQGPQSQVKRNRFGDELIQLPDAGCKDRIDLVLE